MKEKLIFEMQSLSENDLVFVVQKLKKIIPQQAFLLLSGEVGAGKTTFTRFFCKEYSFFDVPSPTYAIHQKYENKEITIHHFDLYRLQSEDDLVSTGFWDLIQDSKSLKIIEWFEKIGDSDWLQFEGLQMDVFRLNILTESDSSERCYQLYQIS